MWERFKQWREKRKTEKQLEFTKKLLMFIIINSIGMMWASYILAFLGRDQIVETLSTTVTTTILSTTIPYIASKTIENISKYGSRLNKTTKDFDKVCEEETSQTKTQEEVKITENIFNVQDNEKI